MNFDLERIRREVEKIVQTGPDVGDSGRLPLTPPTVKALVQAREGGLELSHNYVGTEHLLMITETDQGRACLNREGLAGESTRTLTPGSSDEHT